MKTNKHQTLLLVRKNKAVRAGDIVRQFDYSPATARSYLSFLKKQDLLERSISGHTLTERGENRLQFFEVMGCSDHRCPLCQGKAGRFNCPTCKYRLHRDKARLRPKWTTLLFRREAGVYCPRCKGQIFAEEQARFMGIPEETK